MPDGSFYNFNQYGEVSTFTDRNGNFTTYHTPTTAYPNGYWTDTLGRTIPIPLKPQGAAIETYSIPGIDGNVTYKFHWKLLKGNDVENSGLTDF